MLTAPPPWHALPASVRHGRAPGGAAWQCVQHDRVCTQLPVEHDRRGCASRRTQYWQGSRLSLACIFTHPDLAQLFSTVGKVVSVRAVHFKRPPYRPRGIAFVFMATPADAASAVNQLNNMPLGGRELMVQMAEPLPPTFGRNYTSRSVGACALASHASHSLH